MQCGAHFALPCSSMYMPRHGTALDSFSHCLYTVPSFATTLLWMPIQDTFIVSVKGLVKITLKNTHRHLWKHMHLCVPALYSTIASHCNEPKNYLLWSSELQQQMKTLAFLFIYCIYKYSYSSLQQLKGWSLWAVEEMNMNICKCII